MDIISIKDLEVFAYHGVMQEENVVGQKFSISAYMYLDTRAAGTNDDIDKSVNYAEVCELIKNYSENNTFALIEKLAEGLAKEILLKFSLVDNVRIEIKKPWAPIHMPIDTVSVTIERGWHKAYLSIGSNMGDKQAHLEYAVTSLDEREGIEVLSVSDFIITAPVGGVAQDDFLNGALVIRTIYEPEALLELIHHIELTDDRTREVHWGPRTLDIDIILYDDLIINTVNLTIPHVEAANREFVLKPLAQIAPYAMHPLMGKCIKALLEEFYSRKASRNVQDVDFKFEEITSINAKNTKIAYFGEPGSYSEQAMQYFFGEDGYEAFAFSKFTEVMQAVHEGRADYGIVPIENSSTGGITDIYDNMLDYNIYIVGEQIIKIEHALLGIPGARIEDIQEVYSHAQGIMQCEAFFEKYPNIQLTQVSSTAAGASLVLKENDKTKAAIASKRAASINNLEVLQAGINEQDNNCTRFIILSAKKEYISSAGKISVTFEAKHVSGALYRILSHFEENGINLEKIESRPIPGRTWEYRFFIDVAGNLQMQSVKNAFVGIEEDADNFKIIGNY